MSGTVSALALSGSDLYVGGNFTTANFSGTPVNASRVAKLNTTTGVWSALGRDGGNGVNNNVLALALSGSDLYVGGGFISAGGNISSNLARFLGNVSPTTPTILAAAGLTRQQGSALGNLSIATVNDAEDAEETLLVTVNGGPSATINGVTISNLAVSPAGNVTADVTASCAATTATFAELRVTDCCGRAVLAPLTVTVTPNTPPTLTYANQSVAAGGVLTINPATGPSDNGTINTITVQSAGTYTGALSVNNTTGVVSINLAAPSGTHTITISALDNCGALTNASFTLTVTCPTLTVNPATLANGFAGTAYNQTLTATGGTAPYTFAVPPGSLPNGLTLASGGALTGTPTLISVGTYNFTVTATDSTGCTGTRAYTVIISGNGLQFFPLPQPVRLLETRLGFNGCTMPGAPINANGTLTLPARTPCAGIPAAAAAVTGNITVVPTGPGFLTLFPSTAAQPTVANSNFQTNEITNNVFTVGLGAGDGAFKIFTSATTDVIVDVTGYYAPPNTGGLYFHPLATPVRLLETRPTFTGCSAPGTPLTGTGNPNADPNLDLLLQGRSPVAAPCNSIPATAQVLVGNATSVLPTGGGYLTIYPSGGARPTVASSNYAGSDVINGPFAVKLGTDGKFKIYTFATTHLVVDILGYYSEDALDANGAGLLFNPLPSPVRLLETRAGFAGCTMTGAPIVGNLNAATHTQMAANFCTLPASAQAVVGNVSVVNTTGAGFLTLFPANLTTAPLVATSNYPAPATFGYNRHFFVGLSPADGKFKVLTQFTTDLILDASGYFAP